MGSVSLLPCYQKYFVGANEHIKVVCPSDHHHWFFFWDSNPWLASRKSSILTIKPRLLRVNKSHYLWKNIPHMIPIRQVLSAFSAQSASELRFQLLNVESPQKNANCNKVTRYLERLRSCIPLSWARTIAISFTNFQCLAQWADRSLGENIAHFELNNQWLSAETECKCMNVSCIY